MIGGMMAAVLAFCGADRGPVAGFALYVLLKEFKRDAVADL